MFRIRIPTGDIIIRVRSQALNPEYLLEHQDEHEVVAHRVVIMKELVDLSITA